jgi:hypothetical protein
MTEEEIENALQEFQEEMVRKLGGNNSQAEKNNME